MAVSVHNNRYLLDVRLQPSQGARFAPTGFANIGPAKYERPTADGWEECILVESAQSMANRLEGTMWDPARSCPVDVIKKLPYVVVNSASGEYLTSSREEAHRLASPYIRLATKDSGEADGAKHMTGTEWLREALGLQQNKPLNYRALAAAVFSMDPLALVHGVFFAGKKGESTELQGQPKFPRIVTGFIEASDVKPVESGGVKRDRVSHTQRESGGGSDDGYGSIPFDRTEWTARDVVASFNIDLAQLRSYGLEPPQERLLEAIAKLEISTFLSQPIRLRTNCDFLVSDADFRSRDGVSLESVEVLTDRVSNLVGECVRAGLVGSTTTMVWVPNEKKSKARATDVQKPEQ